VRGRSVMLILILLPVGSVCVTQLAAVVAPQGRHVTPIRIQRPVVSVAVIPPAAVVVMQDLFVTATQRLLVAVFVHHLSAAVARLVLCVTQQLACVFAIIPAAAVVQRVQPVTPMQTLKPVANVCATPPAAAIALPVRCATLIRIPIAAAFAVLILPAGLRAIAIKIAAAVPTNLFAPA